jgi:riboflavin kinase / FMN adenylyltransferase
MKIVYSLKDTPAVKLPCTLTIGFFDGPHLGHKYLLQKAKEHGKNGTTAILTFQNHPSNILQQKKTPLLSTLQERLNSFEKMGIDLVIVEEFTEAFANLNAEDFLKVLRHHLPFSCLILGEGATFGRDQTGNPTTLPQIAKKLNFSFAYIPKLLHFGEEISSSKIRIFLQNNMGKEAKELLH